MHPLAGRRVGVTPSASARHVARARGETARGRPLPRATHDELARLFETRCMPHRRLDASSSRRDETETASSRDVNALTPSFSN